MRRGGSLRFVCPATHTCLCSLRCRAAGTQATPCTPVAATTCTTARPRRTSRKISSCRPPESLRHTLSRALVPPMSPVTTQVPPWGGGGAASRRAVCQRLSDAHSSSAAQSCVSCAAQQLAGRRPLRAGDHGAAQRRAQRRRRGVRETFPTARIGRRTHTFARMSTARQRVSLSPLHLP